MKFRELLEALANPLLPESIECSPDLVQQLAVRIEDLERRFKICLQLNAECLTGIFDQLRYDPARVAFVMNVDGKVVDVFKIKRDDPNVPPKVSKIFTASAFVPGSKERQGQISPKLDAAEKKIGAEVEAYYYAAARVWKILEEEALQKRSAKGIGVILVRNQLFEHAMKGMLYSFAATDQKGPIVKPVRLSGAKPTIFDLGLVPNTNELLLKMLQRIG